MSQAKKVHGAVNVLVAVVAAAASGNPVAGAAASGMAAVGSILDLLGFLPRRQTPIHLRTATLLTLALDEAHLTDAERLLIPQMLELAAVTPAEIMLCARAGDDIAALMARKVAPLDHAYARATTQDAFRRLVAPILTELLADQQVADDLRPAYETAMAAAIRALGQGQDRIEGKLDAQADILASLPDMVAQAMEQMLRKLTAEAEGNPAEAMDALRRMGNSIPGLPAETAKIEAALASARPEDALAQIRETRARLAASRDEATRLAREKGDALARVTRLEADLMWRARKRRESLLLLLEAREEAGTDEVRDELSTLAQRRFNLMVHLRADLGTARDLLDEMVAKGLTPNEVTYSTLIAKAPGFDRALTLRDEMVAKGLTPDEVTYNTLIAKAPGFDRALMLLDEMVAKGLTPNEVTYSTLIAKAPGFDRALTLRDEMVAKGLTPNVFTYSTLIAKAPGFDRALTLRDEMVAKGLTPDPVSYSVLMERADTLAQAEPLLDQMVAAGGTPDSFHFNALLALADSHMAAMRIYRRMVGLKVAPTKHVVTSLIKTAPNEPEARRIVADFLKAGGVADAFMMGAVMVKTRDPKVLRFYFDGMRRKGPKPNWFCMQHLILNAPDATAKIFYLREMRGLGLEPEGSIWQHLARHGVFADDL